MPVSLDQVMTGLGLLGNVLSLPRQVENQQIQNAQTKALLQGAVPDEMLKAATPEPMMRWLSPQQGGFTGHVLGGVGDVGSILSTIVGKPVAAPRLGVSELAEASKLRTANAQLLAKKDLQRVIMDPNATKRDIANAAIAAGSTDQGIRLMRGDSDAKPPASILGLRGTINAMDPSDARLPAYKKALDDQLAWEKQRRDEENQAIIERQPPHYDPAESEKMRHEQVMQDRDKDAKTRGYKEGTPEYDYFMSYGHPRTERAPKAAPTLDDYIEDERRRRNNASQKPGYKEPPESIEDVARRNMAAAQQAGKDQAAGKPLPPPPPPKQKPGAAGGGLAGQILSGRTPEGQQSPQGPPGPSPTLSPPPPSDPNAPAPDSDAAADAILHSIDFASLPADVQKQVTDAASQGMPKWDLANWLLSLQQSQQPPTASQLPR